MKKYTIEIQDNEIIQIGINAIIDFYQTLAIDKEYFDNAVAFTTGVNSPFLNVLFDIRSVRTNSAVLLNSVISFFNKHQVPFSWFILPACNQNDLIQLGFNLTEEAPAMYYNLLDQLPNMKSDFITIHEMEKNDDLKIWIEPINEGFQTKEGDDSYRKLNADILNNGSDRLRHYTALYKNKIAAAGTLFLSNESVMIHNVATKSEFKNHGLGTTLTLHMMKIAKEMGFKHCYLDSSAEAFNLYKRIGFKVYCTTMIYSKN